jgi:hypothetical protein
MRYFDAWFGAHQKINRTACRHLKDLIDVKKVCFPSGREIVRFEGLDGPDGIKRKSPAKNELWHYYDPKNPTDDRILHIISDHYAELVKSLRAKNQTRAAFEASWLAHALVDGLTPAHHYPYEEELVKLRGGQGIETRTSTKEKLIMPGDTLPIKLHNNWKFWGDKGLLATHFAFEWGVAIMATPLRLNKSRPSEHELQEALDEGITAIFLRLAAEIHSLDMYGQFYKSGWTPRLAKTARQELLPRIVNAVTLAWYAAAHEAQLPPKQLKAKAKTSKPKPSRKRKVQ